MARISCYHSGINILLALAHSTSYQCQIKQVSERHYYTGANNIRPHPPTHQLQFNDTVSSLELDGFTRPSSPTKLRIFAVWLVALVWSCPIHATHRTTWCGLRRSYSNSRHELVGRRGGWQMKLNWKCQEYGGCTIFHCVPFRFGWKLIKTYLSMPPCYEGWLM